MAEHRFEQNQEFLEREKEPKVVLTCMGITYRIYGRGYRSVAKIV
jgi:hypothetical protein